jgi:hypothetical protein
MQQNLLFAIVAIGAISAGTIGFANTLTVAAGAVNPIGGNDASVASPTAGSITAVTWTEIASAAGDGDIDIDGADITISNGDTAAHTYEVCAILSDGVSIESGLGCVTTGLIAALGNSVETIDFTTDIDTIVATQVYITLEELT